MSFKDQGFSLVEVLLALILTSLLLITLLQTTNFALNCYSMQIEELELKQQSRVLLNTIQHYLWHCDLNKEITYLDPHQEGYRRIEFYLNQDENTIIALYQRDDVFLRGIKREGHLRFYANPVAMFVQELLFIPQQNFLLLKITFANEKSLAQYSINKKIAINRWN